MATFAAAFGEMPEWSNGAVSKTVDYASGPRVRIPVSPHNQQETQEILRLCSFWYLPIGRKSGMEQYQRTDGNNLRAKSYRLLHCREA